MLSDSFALEDVEYLKSGGLCDVEENILKFRLSSKFSVRVSVLDVVADNSAVLIEGDAFIPNIGFAACRCLNPFGLYKLDIQETS